MKTKITILITILTISFSAFAQSFTYTYDAAGNRVTRVVVIPPSKSTLQNNANTNGQTEEEEEIAEEEMLKDQLGSFELLVYPNPTKGLVVVKISGEETIESATYNVYDAGGKQVASGTVASSMLLVNLNQQIAGTYNLRVTINGKAQTWKIIKK